MQLAVPVAILVVMLAGAMLSARQPKFTSRVDLVQVDALVTGERRPLTGLRPEDFEVRDNGVVQEIESVRRDEVPLDIVLLLDVSGSVEGAPLRALRQAAHAALTTLRAQDRAALVGFAGRVALLAPLTSDRASLARAADRLEAGGLTSLHDALFSTLIVSGTPGRRTLLLAYTDALDTSSWLDLYAPAALASRTDVVIYVVTVAVRTRGRALGSVEDARRKEALARLAERTGGALLPAERETEVRRTFARIVEEFRNRYLITYYPYGVERAGWHDLQVRLKGGMGTVRARRGYFVD